MKRNFSTLFLVLASVLMVFQANAITCKLKGRLVNRTGNALLLIKATGDLRGVTTRIPVVNNEFEYTLEADYLEAYEMAFEEEHQKGAWVPIYFFPDSKEIDFTLYPKNEAYEKNIIKGGVLNGAYAAFKVQLISLFSARLDVTAKKRQALDAKHDYYSAAFDSLMRKITTTKDIDQRRPLYLQREKMAKTGEDLTPNGKLVNAEERAILAERDDWRYTYIRNNVTPVSYFLLLQDSYYRAREEDKIGDYLKETYPVFAKAFPDHVYTKRLANEVAGLKLRKPGQAFVDFSAPDLSGKTYTFSELLDGKMTLLDLWGSWCGPCIAASRTMVPVYNEFKDKGFQVIGVAREFEKLDNLKGALKREKYPWLNLVDLDDKREVWSKYNISNAGGAIFLFDKNGKILAVDPTAEEVRKFLVASLKP